eukprot:s7565_g1.t1
MSSWSCRVLSGLASLECSSHWLRTFSIRHGNSGRSGVRCLCSRQRMPGRGPLPTPTDRCQDAIMSESQTIKAYLKSIYLRMQPSTMTEAH